MCNRVKMSWASKHYNLWRNTRESSLAKAGDGRLETLNDDGVQVVLWSRLWQDPWRPTWFLSRLLLWNAGTRSCVVLQAKWKVPKLTPFLMRIGVAVEHLRVVDDLSDWYSYDNRACCDQEASTHRLRYVVIVHASKDPSLTVPWTMSFSDDARKAWKLPFSSFSTRSSQAVAVPVTMPWLATAHGPPEFSDLPEVHIVNHDQLSEACLDNNTYILHAKIMPKKVSSWKCTYASIASRL